MWTGRVTTSMRLAPAVMAEGSPGVLQVSPIAGIPWWAAVTVWGLDSALYNA